MRTFAYRDIAQHRAEARHCALLSKLSEHKGRFETVRQTHPDLLAALEREAFAADVHASARIEGINVSVERVRELVEGAQPRTDRERQIVGYAELQRRIDEDPQAFPVAAGTIVRMHAHLLPDARFGTRSRYRKRDFMDVVTESGVERVQVSPIAAFETPLYLGAACDSLAEALDADTCCRLLLVPHFTVDMLCIRPFDEGTARLARLMARLLMRRMGLDVGRYMGIDALCERDAARYYEALNRCASGWERGENSYDPFVTYWLATVCEAYEGLFEKASLDAGGAPSKPTRIRRFFERNEGEHAKRDVAEALPDISISTIENTLRALTEEGVIERLGSARATRYRLKR